MERLPTRPERLSDEAPRVQALPEFTAGRHTNHSTNNHLRASG